MQQIIGIDFSGGVNAGRKIWIATGHVENNVLLIESCVRGEALPASGCERAECLAALRAFIRSSGDAFIGLDFPLGIPRELMDGQTWRQFISTFADRCETPLQFRQACFVATQGRELKRRTDLEAKTPFSPYNLRLYRQTYYGLRDVIAPLVRDRSVRVLPMQAGRSDVPSLIEICPASTLKRLKLYRPYKGRSIDHRAARLLIWQALHHLGLKLAGRLQPIVLADPEGDALDSVIAAWATVQAQALIEIGLDRMAVEYRTEGYVYA